MGTVALNRVGSIDLIDLVGICELQGRDGLPYPFWRTQPSSTIDDDAVSVAGRFADGDLRIFRAWAEAYLHADIWVTCRVNYANDDPDMRILAYRADQSGFLATQQPGEDVVDVYTVSPYELGAAIAGSVDLAQPGTRPRIVIPGYIAQYTDTASTRTDEVDYTIRFSPVGGARSGRSRLAVPAADVSVMTTVQSRCRPAREWGTDWGDKLVVAVRVNDDGDYVYAPDFSHATPMRAQDLSQRIDRLIAHDVATLRQQRGLD